MELSEVFERGEVAADVERQLMDRWRPLLERVGAHEAAAAVQPPLSHPPDASQTPSSLHLHLHQHQIQALIIERNAAHETQQRAHSDYAHLEEAHKQANEKLTLLDQQRHLLETMRAEFMLEIKNKFTAFISAKEYFKSKLNMYYTVEETPDAREMEVLIEFFKTKKTKSQNHSVTLHKSNDGIYKLIGMKPMLPIFDKLVQRLKETNDVPGFLCCVRYCFQKFCSSNSQHKFS
ncbi:uncharacterized protein LOC143912635 [Arctopsyche grandis]|uniref:uncharacterized protein LOC143912635 n=1 Tax=Arctopsyche grandis TaxID=121162 RepID=UPI00406D8909